MLLDIRAKLGERAIPILLKAVPHEPEQMFIPHAEEVACCLRHRNATFPASLRQSADDDVFDIGMRPLRRAIVATFMCGADRAHKLHVLLRHRLLRQPHGFEGIGLVEERLPARDLPVPEGQDERGAECDLLLAAGEACRVMF
jgi:hypothetical protein